MLDAILLDNDVVLKMCAYAAADRLLQVATYAAKPPAILQVASFALQSQVRRSRSIADHEAAAAQLTIMLDGVQRLEPTEQEISLAADLEERAQHEALELDPGESQLVAILLYRCAPLLVTGDKRALAALASVAPAEADGRMACLEQAVAAIIADDGYLVMFRNGVCSCRPIDKAIANCFSCSSETVSSGDVMGGLRSYIGALRTQAGRLLIGSDDLLAIPAQEDRVGFV